MYNVGFLIRSPLDYFVYKNTYRYLKNEGYPDVNLIVKRIYGIPICESYSERFFKYIKTILKEYNEDFISDSNTNWDIEDEHKAVIYTNNGLFTNAKKIRMLYSHAKENLTMSSFACKNFDLILTFGQRSKTLCERFATSEIIGAPKYDDWFSDNVNPESISEHKFPLDKTKKTILYIPTWGEAGSIDTYYQAINSLVSQYNVILKCHDSTFWREPEKLKKFDKNILIVNGNCDIQVLFSIADVVIGDNSGAILESLYLDKPTIFLKVENYAPNSIEQSCRKKFLSIEDPLDIGLLNNQIKRSIDKPNEFKQERFLVTKDLYEYRDGKCAERAGKAIIEFLG